MNAPRHYHYQPSLWRLAQCVWRRQDDNRAPRPPDPPLRNHRNRQRELTVQTPRLSTTPACPGGQTGTSHARRSVAREGTARRARDPPVRYRDKPAPTPVRGPFSMPIRGPDCLPFDLTHRPQAWGALQQRHYLAVPNPQTADRAVGGRAALSFAAAGLCPGGRSIIPAPSTPTALAAGDLSSFSAFRGEPAGSPPAQP